MHYTRRMRAPLPWRVLTPSLQAPVNLRMTLCGGQCFHWYPTPRNTFIGAIHQQVFELREVHNTAAAEPLVKKHTISGDPSASPAVAASCSTNGKPNCGRTEGEVCHWIEYRKLWPYAMPDATSSNASLRRSRARSVASPASPQLTITHETDEKLLARYLSLDVDLGGLWGRWTDAQSTRDHPLVTYLTGHKRDATTSTASDLSAGAASSAAAAGGGGAHEGVPFITIRHVRQDVHSCLFSFLCSQNNNVTRITSMVYTLCRTYGDHLCDLQLSTGDVRPPPPLPPAPLGGTSRRRRATQEEAAAAAVQQQQPQPPSLKRPTRSAGKGDWFSLYSFPNVTQLTSATIDKLRQLGFGYRSRYVVEAVKSIASFSAAATALARPLAPLLLQQHAVGSETPFYADILAHSGDLAYQRAALQGLCGVGRKVADCVLLFSLEHTDLVPVDTHMAQVAVEYLATSAAEKQTSKKKPAAHSRKRARGDSDAKDTTTGANVAWQAELLQWGAKAQQLKVEAAKKRRKSTAKASRERDTAKLPRSSKSAPSAAAASGTEEEDVGEARLPVPPLYERHHDAIQRGFGELFGPHAGWAHSILFYYRMRK